MGLPYYKPLIIDQKTLFQTMSLFLLGKKEKNEINISFTLLPSVTKEINSCETKERF